MANHVPFDDRLNQRARVEDLSRELMCDFLKEVGSDLAAKATTLPLVELGRQLNVVGGSVDAPFPHNVGLLFFNPEPHRFFPAIPVPIVRSDLLNSAPAKPSRACLGIIASASFSRNSNSPKAAHQLATW